MSVTPLHATAGFVVAAATATAGDHGITLAIITAIGGVAVVVAGPLVTDWLRHHRKPPVDHTRELIDEQADFIEHLRAELADARGEIQDLTNENKRLRRGDRRG